MTLLHRGGVWSAWLHGRGFAMTFRDSTSSRKFARPLIQDGRSRVEHSTQATCYQPSFGMATLNFDSNAARHDERSAPLILPILRSCNACVLYNAEKRTARSSLGRC